MDGTSNGSKLLLTRRLRLERPKHSNGGDNLLCINDLRVRMLAIVGNFSVRKPLGTSRTTMRSLSFIAVFLASFSALGAEPRVVRDLPYIEPKNERQLLDVYAPAEGKDHPVIVWIHGGGWRRGDKGGLRLKPQFFNDRGFVLVSATYRFAPEVSIKEMMGDVAKAIRWTHEHAKEYGGDPNSIVVMGHSAGAHLAALACTDERYLQAEGLSLKFLKGCVPVDVSVYDIPSRLADGPIGTGNLAEIFGKTVDEQRDVSPAAHVARDKHIPPFLILHVLEQPPTKSQPQSERFAKVLQDAGIAAKVYGAAGKTHGTISSDIGAPDDPLTAVVKEFLDSVKR